MANRVTRGQLMDASVKVRCLKSDVEAIHHAARMRGCNMSTMIRQMLIAEGIITP